MAWSFQIARVLGIPIRLHVTFLLLIGWLAFLAPREGPSLVVALGLFACVVAHELGHSVVARRYGVEVRDITLLPIGGVARMAKIPREPAQEFWIAIAGPAVNFVLGPVLLAIHGALGGAMTLEGVAHAPLAQLGALNLALGVFNLLPAFPMDGGRILRALLALRMPYPRATHIATSLGQALAFLLGFLGLMGNPMILFVALFVFIGAAEEGGRVQTQAFIEGVPVSAAMVTRFFTLSRADSLGRASDLLLEGTQHDFPVVEGAAIVGVLTRGRLLEALAERGRDVYVSEVMDPAPQAVEPTAPLLGVLEAMAGTGQTLVPVCTPQGLVGLVTSDNTTEYVLVQTALLRNRETHAPP